MGDSTIGIKVADGSFYPVLEHGFTGTKKLTLTTAKNNQGKVQIDLYRGNGATLTEAHFIGTLTIDNIPPASKGEPEIELLLGIDDDGQLSARASDSSTGESQKFSTTIATASADEFEEPEFEVEDTQPGRIDFEEAPLTGESYPVTEEDRRERVHAKGPNILLLILFVIFGVLLVAAIAYFVYRSIPGPRVPSLSTTGAAATAPAAQPAPAAQEPAPAAAAQPAPAPAAAAPAPAPVTPPKPAATGGVTYRIKNGDTLWDIAATYYRNPWLYPKLAKANSIRNPDLIFAGTRIKIPEN